MLEKICIYLFRGKKKKKCRFSGSIETPRSKRDRYHEPPRADFVANHPFIFAITYERNVLFLGRVKKF